MTPRQTYEDPSVEADIYFDDEPQQTDARAELLDIVIRSRTWEARANRFAVLRWMRNPTTTQAQAAKELRITERRFRQILREIRISIS